MKKPWTPYVGMPAARNDRPSVAPITMIGTVCTPGHIACVTSVTARRTSARNGDAGLCTASPSCVMATSVSAITLRSDSRTYATPSSGNTRQFTVAAASCGSAFIAWPPSSIVATHVVRSVAFHPVDPLATRCIAAREPAATCARSARTAPVSILAICLKYAAVTSLVFSGKPNRDSRSSAPARW